MNWTNAAWQQPLINLFMDFETFGEHQWADTGIFDFLDHALICFSLKIAHLILSNIS